MCVCLAVNPYCRYDIWARKAVPAPIATANVTVTVGPMDSAFLTLTVTVA